MADYVTQIVHLANGDSFEYVNYEGTWFTYGKNIQNEGWKYKENEKLRFILNLIQTDILTLVKWETIHLYLCLVINKISSEGGKRK